MKLKGKTALITGTNRGIGRAIVEKFAKEGANIIAHARKPYQEFETFLEDTKETNNIKITPVYFDLRDEENLKKELTRLVKSKIPVDILVNSAGKEHGGFFQMTPDNTIKEIFEINLFAQMQITRIMLKSLMKQKSSSIINISSVSGIDLPQGNCAYGVSKAAFIAFTKVLAAEYGRFNVRINTIAPGLIDTNMFRKIEEKAKNGLIARSSLNRLGSPDEVANLAAFLASDEASFINGQIIRIDGGMV